MKNLFKLNSDSKFRGICQNDVPLPEIGESVEQTKGSLSQKKEDISKKVSESKDTINKVEVKIESLSGIDIGPLLDMFNELKGSIGLSEELEGESETDSKNKSNNKSPSKNNDKYSGLFRLTGQKMSAEDLIRKAEEYKGTKYELGGDDYSGIDCSGLLVAAANKAGVATGDSSAANFYKMSAEIENKDIRPGDAMFWINPVDHVAIIKSVNPDGSFTTIESAAGGDVGVKNRKRTFTDNHGDIEIRRLPFVNIA